MKTFNQIYIKSEADLPKEEGYYYWHRRISKDEIVIYTNHVNGDEEYEVLTFDWYLIEAPDNRDEIIAKMRELISKLNRFAEFQQKAIYNDIDEEEFDVRVSKIKRLESELSALEAVNNYPCK